jgi:aminoglycoside 6'-N-acetyltransferase
MENNRLTTCNCVITAESRAEADRYGGFMSTAELQGEHVRLRPVADADIARLTALAAAPEIARWWGEYDEDKMRIEVSAPRLTAWTVEVDGEISGLVIATEELDPDYRSVELDIFIAAPLHGRGLGSDALRTALRHLFAERGHHRAMIGPAAENEQAIRSYERVGFRPVGVMRQAERISGHWRNVLVMDILAGELR